MRKCAISIYCGSTDSIPRENKLKYNTTTSSKQTFNSKITSDFILYKLYSIYNLFKSFRFNIS